MSNPLSEVWSAVLDDLTARFSLTAVETWLRPLRARAGADSVLLLEAPNRFHLTYVKDKFEDVLRREIFERLGGDGKLEIVLAPNGHDVSPETNGSEAPAPPAATATATAINGRDGYDDAFLHATRPMKRATESTPLNPKYTFEHFVVGKSNQFAHAAARAVAEHPATAYNPLFIFGGSGLGKTHIMQAIGNYIPSSLGPHTKIHYASAENFMNEMIVAIQQGRTIDFRNKYRAIDVLLIDDIHFLQGKESTQEEFFHTFNALHGAGKQVVLTSDRPPKEIPTLEERLVSRFEWGLVTDIQPPDLETRIAILRKKADDDHLEIPLEVLEYIASNVRSNIRELEGSLIRLLAYASLTGSDIDLDLARNVLNNFLKKPDKMVSVETIQQAVSDHFGIPEEAMKVKKRTNSLVFPRQVAMYLSRQLTSLSLSDLGSRFGGRDHSTVLHACEKIEKLQEEDIELRRVLQCLTSTLRR